MLKNKIKLYLITLLISIISVTICGFIWTSNPYLQNNTKYKQALQSYEKQNYLLTIKLLQQINPHGILEAKKCFLLGKSYTQLGYTQKALSHLNKAQNELTQIKDVIIYEKAQNYVKSNQLRQAITCYKKIPENYPESPFVPRTLFELGEVNYLLDNLKEAIASYYKLFDHYPNNKDADLALLRIARIYEQQQNYSSAYKMLKKILYRYPETIHKDLVARHIQQIPTKSDYSEYKPEAEDTYAGAKYYHTQKQYQKSNRLLKQLISHHPYSILTPSAIFLIGKNKYLSRHYDSALLSFKNLLKTYPHDRNVPAARFYRGKIYQKKGMYNYAVQEYQKITNYFPQSQFVDKSLYNLGKIYKARKNYNKAFTYYSKLFIDFPSSNLADDAIWKVGNYYYQKQNYQKAFKIFNYANNLNIKDDFTARCIYWGGKAAKKVGNYDEALKLHSKVYNEYPNSYYAFRIWENFAKKHEGRNVLVASRGEKKLNSTPELKFNNERINLLMEFSYQDATKHELYRLKSEKTDDDPLLIYKLLICREKFKEEKYQESIKEIEQVIKNKLISNQKLPDIALQHAYPKLYWETVQETSQKYDIDPYLILALIREESRFNVKARSWANAIGLMQIMPRTGADIARRLNYKNFHQSQLYHPETNIKMGVYYFSKLKENFDNNLALALASYNAGPSNLYNWWAGHKNDDIDEFIESIPYQETRFYIQKVLKSYWIYKQIYS